MGKTHNIITFDTVNLAPSGHDECVVGSDHGNNVDPLALQLVELLNVWGQVACRATGGESAFGLMSAICALVDARKAVDGGS